MIIVLKMSILILKPYVFTVNIMLANNIFYN